MTVEGTSEIFRALALAQVQYLVVGGLAVVAHGHVRYTADVDLVLNLEPDNVRRALAVFESLGYRPRIPVPLEGFLDPAMRNTWARERNMLVFSLHSERFRATEVDLFVEPPLDFELAYARARRWEVAPGIEVTFVGLEDLIALKKAAGRPVDLEDIRRLEQLRQGDGNA